MTISAIIENGHCAGCGLCAGVEEITNLEMKMSANGYLRPVEKDPLSEQEEELIEKICPGTSLAFEPMETAQLHDVWGSIKSVGVGAATDASFRNMGSSGGALSALLTYLLEGGLVDFVVQTGTSPDAPELNCTRQSVNGEEVLAAAGSRYSPAAPLSDIATFFEREGKFAFVGKPCDVAGLRQYLELRPELKHKAPFLLSFMCGGTPSQKGTDAILDHFGVSPADLKSIRYRGNGWPGMLRVETKSGAVHEMDYDSSWGGILNQHLQFRCKICPDGVGQFADVVCADAWHLDEEGRPGFSEEEGRSLMIVRTESGQRLLSAAIRSEKIDVTEVSADQIDLMQPYQKKRRQLIKARLLAMWLRGMRRPRFDGLRLLRTAISGGLMANFRSLAGAWVRFSQTERKKCL